LTLTALGHLRDSSRAVFVAESTCIEDLPQIISLSCSRFVLLLAYDHTKTPARLVQTLGRLLDQGCVYLCTWGPGCEHVHDTMDEVVLERELQRGDDETITTTWHHGVPLEEAVDFALRHAMPDDALSQGCDAVVLAAVGDAGWAQALPNMAQPHLASGPLTTRTAC
jgi:hypothetical protein